MYDILHRDGSGVEQELKVLEREPKNRVVLFWVWDQNSNENSFLFPGSGNTFILLITISFP